MKAEAGGLAGLVIAGRHAETHKCTTSARQAGMAASQQCNAATHICKLMIWCIVCASCALPSMGVMLNTFVHCGVHTSVVQCT